MAQGYLQYGAATAMQCTYCGRIRDRTVAGDGMLMLKAVLRSNQEKCPQCQEVLKEVAVPKSGTKKEWKWKSKTSMTRCPQEYCKKHVDGTTVLVSCRRCGTTLCTGCCNKCDHVEGYEQYTVEVCSTCSEHLNNEHRVVAEVTGKAAEEVKAFIKQEADLRGLKLFVESKVSTEPTQVQIREYVDGLPPETIIWKPTDNASFAAQYEKLWAPITNNQQAPSSECSACGGGSGDACTRCREYFRGKCTMPAVEVVVAKEAQDTDCELMASLLSSYLKHRMQVDNVRFVNPIVRKEDVRVCAACLYKQRSAEGECEACGGADLQRPAYYLRVDPLMPDNTKMDDMLRVVKYGYEREKWVYDQKEALCKGGHTMYCKGYCGGKCGVQYSLNRGGTASVAQEAVKWTVGEKSYTLSVHADKEVVLTVEGGETSRNEVKSYTTKGDKVFFHGTTKKATKATPEVLAFLEKHNVDKQ
eukprot:TRINITY_DN8935_c0_g1_i1.p1 TRINITY_DN8935_c0_g1~~TRINITY_DN8935_c0_g1_i1.p1  ORF type:complete len:472 (+),score=146.27 TRINITY_DN8935_c0_g1_i1:33-1448(+)